jgi:hypothetical protein
MIVEYSPNPDASAMGQTAAHMYLAAPAQHDEIEDPWAAEILLIMRRRELVYRVFVCVCALVCLLLLLAFWFNWEW